jgi:hypothetical protein
MDQARTIIDKLIAIKVTQAPQLTALLDQYSAELRDHLQSFGIDTESYREMRAVMAGFALLDINGSEHLQELMFTTGYLAARVQPQALRNNERST